MDRRSIITGNRIAFDYNWTIVRREREYKRDTLIRALRIRRARYLPEIIIYSSDDVKGKICELLDTGYKLLTVHASLVVFTLLSP